MTMAERHFRKNSTTFNCQSCGRLTRDTAGTNQQLCPQCDTWTMIENSILNDALIGRELAAAEARIAQLKAEAVKKGGQFEEVSNNAPAQAEAKLRPAL
jgi:predicted ATP-dependent serine protease